MKAPKFLFSLLALFAMSGVPVTTRADGPEDRQGPTRAYLGVSLEAVQNGLRVTTVAPNSPAVQAGIQVGDVIISARGTPPGTVQQFVTTIRLAGVGTFYPLTIDRAGQQINFNVRLTAAPREGASVGQPAPAISSQVVMGGGPADLAQLRGRVVVVDFWASWCGPCLSMMPALNDIHRRLNAQGLTILGITDESAANARATGSRMSIGYTLATDPTAARRYGVRGLPTTVVIDRRGNIRRIGVGADVDEVRQIEALVQRLLAEQP